MTDTLEPKPAKPTKVCPDCHVLSAVGSNPHCHGKSCTWNICRCGTTYDRNNGNSFTNKKAA